MKGSFRKVKGVKMEAGKNVTGKGGVVLLNELTSYDNGDGRYM